ncbi:Rab-GAP TBC domain-containing protein [Entamoeba marina]
MSFEERMNLLQQRYPYNFMTTFFSVFSRHTTYDGNTSNISEIIDALKTCDRDQIHYLCRNGVPKELRGPVWYSMATSGISYNEIISLHSKQLYNDYWKLANNIGDIEIDKKTERVIDADVVRLFPDGYRDVFRMQEVRDQIRRIKIIYQYQYPVPGYYQGMGDTIALFYIVFAEYYFGPLTPQIITKADTEDLKIVESACYTLCKYFINNINKYCYKEDKTIQFHPEAIWSELVKEWEMRGFYFKKGYDEMIFKQQLYKFLVCFFARELDTKNAIAVYDLLVCGTCGDVFTTVVKLVMAFVETLKERGANLKDLYSFNNTSKQYFKTITNDDVSQLIGKTWYM